MKYEIARFEGKEYLHIIRPASTRLTEIKVSRQRHDDLINWSAIKLMLSDCREVNFEAASILDVDTLAAELKDDLPNCKRIAVIAQSYPSRIFTHFENICGCLDIEVRFFSELKPAEMWLCEDQG